MHLIKAYGEWEQVSSVLVKGASIEHFLISLMTPFQRCPEASEEMKAWVEEHGQSDKLRGDYSVSIWTSHKKVLNLHWQAGQPVEVLSFRRGDWESELLDLGSREGG